MFLNIILIGCSTSRLTQLSKLAEPTNEEESECTSKEEIKNNGHNKDTCLKSEKTDDVTSNANTHEKNFASRFIDTNMDNDDDDDFGWYF